MYVVTSAILAALPVLTTARRRRLLRSSSRLSLHPLRQPAPVLFQQKRADTKTLPEDTVRFWITPRARNPLPPDFVLCRRKPFLRQNLHQSRLQIENKQSESGIVIRQRLVAAGIDQFIDHRQLRRNLDPVHART